MSFKFEIEVTGLEPAYRMARAVRNLGEDVKPLLSIAGSVLERSTVRRFETGVGVGGVPWPKSKRAARSGGKTLVDTNRLLNSIASEVVSPNEVKVGSRGLDVKEKLVNQFGSNRQAVVLGHRRTITQAFGVPLRGGPKQIDVRAHGV